MRYSLISLGALALAMAAAPAMAQETTETEPTPAITVTAAATAISDYRFRGLTQTDESPAFQATINVNHESGFYVGTWGSTIDNKVSLPGYGGTEIDLYGGYTKTLDSGVAVDVGLLYYFYGGAPRKNKTDFFEPYATVSYTAGPVTAKVGANYSWSGQQGLAGKDSIYLHGDAAFAIPKTPISILGHVGRTDGQLGVLAPSSKYLDWSVGAEGVYKVFKLGVQYVDTDITSKKGYADAIGADPTVLGYLTITF